MSLISSAACKDNKPLKIEWKVAAVLPDVDGKASLGYAGPVTGIFNHQLFIAGGANFPDSMPWLGGKKKYYDAIAHYQISDSGIQLMPQQLKLPDTIAYSAVCSIENGIIYAGGENVHGLNSKVWLIKNKMKDSILFISLPDLPEATTNGALTYHDHSIYFIGGEIASGVSDKMYMLNLENLLAGWKELASLPHPASHGVFVSQANQLFYMGGRMRAKSGISDLYANMYVYDFSKNIWQEKKSLPYPLSAGTGVAYQKDKIILFGGDKGTTFHKTEQLIAAIAIEKDSLKKNELIKEKAELQLTHPGFSNQIMVYQINTDVWELAGTINYPTPVTTTAILSKNTIFIPSGEIKAGVRSNQILQGILQE
ncbi:MAG: hypothetical protein JST23_11700 [Bacteroidetes bacterium]|nr:hypothetical protein [Bacteroidota bacterium]